MGIERTFQNIPEGSLSEADQPDYLVNLGWSRAPGWQELLSSKRVLIVSEAGAGKTYECRSQCKRLWDAGEPAFYLELADLAKGDLRNMLGFDEEARLDAWLSSQSDIATFFLDSIDELKLSLGSFEQALKHLAKGVAGQLGRMRIVITTRPIPFDEKLVRQRLPVPPLAEIEANGETFAQIALQDSSNKKKEGNDDGPPDWRTVALLPLSDTQIADFARNQGVDEPQALLDDLRRRNAEEFARRPQDLIELCADWRDFKRIRTHREQVESSVRIKLKPREDRLEPAELSAEKAFDGASRLALAMMVTRRLTIRHSAEADSSGDDVPLDPAAILSDWNPDERKALLERPLFGFASYGRVRFHHRSVAQYLAAERIKRLRKRGMCASALKRLLFAHTKGKTIVRPSKRPIAGWLALDDSMIFETLRDNEPAVLLTEGDPESLTSCQRSDALRSYVERYGKGGWRGLSVPHIQIHRFASPDLATEIKRLWAQGIENLEIREILLNLIDTGRITACADIAHVTAHDTDMSFSTRLAAIEALATLNDPRIETIAAGITENSTLWPDDLVRGVVLRLFPKHLVVTRLCQILERLEMQGRSVDGFHWNLSRLIGEADLDLPTLEALRNGLSELSSSNLRWQEEWPQIVSDRFNLSSALAATCVRGLQISTATDWLGASALALRLPHQNHSHHEEYTQLSKLLTELSAKMNEQLFWAEDALIQSIHLISDPWDRYYQIEYRGAVQLNSLRDLDWIRAALADTTRPSSDRAMLLEAAMRLVPSQEEWSEHIISLKSIIADLPELLAVIDKRLKSSKPSEKHQKWKIEEAKREQEEKKQTAKDHASWVEFWKEVADQPDAAFSPERSGNTAWYLWRAMSKVGDESRSSGWNRRFIEAYFSKETADRLRLTLMDQWRKDRPTLTSERAEDAKGTYLVRWQLGLAAIYAEAEDPEWTTKISSTEATVATRFATIELNSLPLWTEALVKEHSAAVETTLGKELRLEIDNPAGPNWHSMLLQKIGHAPDPVVAIFLPSLRSWLDSNDDYEGENKNGAAQRLGQIVDILTKHGDSETHAHLSAIAQQRLREKISTQLCHLWLSTLMRLNANSAIDELESQIELVQPAKRSEAVILFGNVFGDRHGGINLTNPKFSPQSLLKLLRLAYRHVRSEDDAKHDGGYSPDARDNAEQARSCIVDALLKSDGEEGWSAKLEMAADPLCAHFKDRIIAMAQEHWAEEVDGDVLDDTQAIALDKTGEAPPSSNEAMFAIMVDRLDDLDDLLLRDESPRELWAGISEERVMRRAVAEKLNHHANGLYKIDQEAVTADEKETDIRLLSTTSPHEAVIELKLADGRSANDLRDTLEAQLVKKYMATETRRSGCLMITISKNRHWNHPDTGSKIDFKELVTLLREEADNIMQKLGSSLRLHICALDLRPRLPTEAKRKKAENNSKSSRSAK
tara:strand:+ start:501 stop:4835 length:4335 start_codon:yes stop_codon:yes gene_type:complete